MRRGGSVEPGVRERGRHALATLLHLAGRKADEHPMRHAARDVDLDADVVGVDSEDGGGADGGKHAVMLRTHRPSATS